MIPTVLLAGRRPDPPDAEARRLPVENVLLVRERLRALFVERRPAHLVCSAACGADLLALDVAGDLGVRRHVVLPFAAAEFREASVTDRPGHWGPLYDRVVREIEAEGRLTVLSEVPETDEAFAAANDALLQTATALDGALVAVAVWEGAPRGHGDLTAHLVRAAERAGAETLSVLTTS